MRTALTFMARALRRLLVGALITLVFLLASAGSVLVHSNLPLLRSLAAETVSRLLSDVFQGRIVIRSFDHLSADQILVSQLEVQDAQGRSLLTARKVNAHASLLSIAREVLSDSDPVTIAVRHVRVEHADVEVRLDPGTGRTTLEQALTPRASSTPTPGSGRPGKQLSLWFPTIELGEVLAHVELEQQSLTVLVTHAKGRVRIEPKGVRVDVERFSTALSGTGIEEMRGTGAAHLQFPGANQVEIQGSFGQTEFLGRFRQRGSTLNLEIDIPRAEPQAMKALWPAWPVLEPLEVHLRTSGVWPVFKSDADVTFASGAELDAEGTLQMEPTPKADLRIFASAVDLRSFIQDAPATALTLNGRVAATLAPAGAHVDFSATSDATVVAEQAVPRCDVAGVWDEHGLSLQGQLFEPHAPTTFRMETAADGTLHFHAQSNAVTLGTWRFASDGIDGTTALSLDAQMQADHLDWQAQAEVSNLKLANVHARHASLQAHGSGSLGDLQKTRGALNAKGTDLQIGDLRFQQFDLSAQGAWNNPQITLKMNSGQEHAVELTGSVTVSPKLAFRNVEFHLNEQDLRLSGKISRFEPEGPVLEAQQLSLTGGGGTLSGWLRYQPGLVETNIDAQDLDLARIARTLGLGQYDLRGKAQLQLELTAGADVTRGRIALTLAKASWAGVGSATIRVQGQLHDRDLSLEMSGIDPLIGAFGGRADARLAGSVLQRESFVNATGSAEIQVDGLPLEPIALALKDRTPLKGLTGRGAARVQFERREAQALPDVFAEVTLSDLGFSTELLAGSPLTLNNSRLISTLSLSSQTGELNAALALSDTHGELVVASGTLRSDARRIIAQPDQAKTLLENAPLDLVISLSPRSFDDLPIEIAGVTGTLALRATVRGSLAQPRLAGMLSALSLRSRESPKAAPLDLVAHAEYTPRSDDLSVEATVSHQGLRVASAAGQWHLQGAPASNPAQNAGALEAHLDDFPLQVLAPLANAGVSGSLSGAIRLSAQPSGVELRAMLSPHGIGIPGANLGDGTLLLDGTQNLIHGELKLGTFPSTLDARILLGIAPEQYLNSVVFDVDARKQEASLLGFALVGLLSRLSGPIDAQAHVVMSRKAAAEPWSTQIDGLAQWHSGTAHVDTLGLELRDIEATALARSMGERNVISITGLRAKARSNTHNLVGDANLSLQGLTVTTGDARLSIRDFPFTLEGVPKGWGTGIAHATLARKPAHMLVTVNVDALDVRLPAGASREVLEVRENPDFVILQRETETADQSGLPWRFVIDLGTKTRVMRSDVDLLVSGTPQLDLGKQVNLSGNLLLQPGGRFQALGKPFIVEHGTVSLNPNDAGNPTIDVRAAFRSPDGVSVYAVAHGPLKELDGIQLSSDGGLSQEEIWQRIAGASSGVTASEGSAADAEGGSAAGNAGLGVAALGVNDVLGSSMKDVEIRVDPGENQSYTAAVRLSDKLWFEGRYQRDDTAAMVGGPSNVVSGAFDYRFARKWSLRTELGNAGGTFDLLWQHRY